MNPAITFITLIIFITFTTFTTFTTFIMALSGPASPPPFESPLVINPAFEHITIAADSDFEACGVADFDRDGDLDIVCGDTWYESPDWTRHPIGLIRSVGGYRIDFADVPMDVDGDGWIDVVSCSWHDRGVFWRRNPGTPDGDWKMQIIDRPGNMETAIGADVDGDGRLDFVPNTVNATVWYSLSNGTLVPHLVSADRGGHGVGVGDVNGDGRPDILGPDGWFRGPEDPIKGHGSFMPTGTSAALASRSSRTTLTAMDCKTSSGAWATTTACTGSSRAGIPTDHEPGRGRPSTLRGRKPTAWCWRILMPTAFRRW